jgi:hypothetical protein
LFGFPSKISFSLLVTFCAVWGQYSIFDARKQIPWGILTCIEEVIPKGLRSHDESKTVLEVYAARKRQGRGTIPMGFPIAGETRDPATPYQRTAKLVTETMALPAGAALFIAQDREAVIGKAYEVDTGLQAALRGG